MTDNDLDSTKIVNFMTPGAAFLVLECGHVGHIVKSIIKVFRFQQKNLLLSYGFFFLFLPASPKAKAGLGVQSLRPSVRPSVCPSVCPSVRPKILSSQLL